MKTFFRGTLTVSILVVGLVVIAGCAIDGVKPSAAAGKITLAWDANTEADLGGYTLHYGLSSGEYTKSVDVGRATSYTVSGLQGDNDYYFALSAYSTSGAESGMSGEVAYTPVSD